MSIISQITKIETAKSNILSAIQGKGVQIPSSAKLADCPSLINQIQEGGSIKYGELMSVDVYIQQSYSYYLSEVTAVIDERGTKHTLYLLEPTAFDEILNRNLNIPIIFGYAAAGKTVLFSILNLGTSLYSSTSLIESSDAVLAMSFLVGKIESFSYDMYSPRATLTVNYRPIIE